MNKGQKTATAIAQAAIYGFASGMGRQAARDTYNKMTDTKLQPDTSKAVLPVSDETSEVVFDYLEKDQNGDLYYVSKQKLPLVWYDKRWKKFREGCRPDGTKEVVASCQFSKADIDTLVSQKGYTIVLKDTNLHTVGKEKSKEKISPLVWILSALGWTLIGILLVSGIVAAAA
jgi:hypothetical protein